MENGSNQTGNRQPTPFMEQERERSLIVRAKAGDDEAFAALADAYRRLVYWQINRCASAVPDSDREDLFQEALVGLLKAVRTYDGVTSAFSTYATSCIYHSIISAVRRYLKQSAPSVSLEETELVTGSSPESVVLDRESGAWLYDRVFSELSPYEKTVFELYLSDQTYAQIAKTIGKTEKSIANAICRIRRKLRVLLS